VNGDGFDDIIIGSPGDVLGGGVSTNGQAFVYFGAQFEDLALNGFVINGITGNSFTGASVASAGDVNGDGQDDFIIGAGFTQSFQGESYVVFGQLHQTVVQRLGTGASQKLVGGNFDDALIGLGGDDQLYGNGGNDLLTGGADNDVLKAGAGTDTAIYSGNRADYSVTQNANGSITLTDTRGPGFDGTDTVYDAELFQFDDQTQTTAQLLNLPPAITSNGGGDTADLSIAENTTAVTTVTATDPEGDLTLTYSIAGGADAGKFTINAMTGALAFIVAPDFELPTDAAQIATTR
jgi:hypothetical protein